MASVPTEKGERKNDLDICVSADDGNKSTGLVVLGLDSYNRWQIDFAVLIGGITMTNTRENLIELLGQVQDQARKQRGFGTFCFGNEKVADHLIANGVTFAKDNNVPSKWIPVTERLPETNERVLICSELGNQYVAQHFGGRFYVDGTNIKTSHWMPLPEPPKGE